MLVGEVREAMTGAGVSWKLSGGSQFSPAVTKVSKKCQVVRAVRRRKSSWPRFNSGSDDSIGWLIHQAIHGAASQRPRKGSATGHWSGCRASTRNPPSSATAGATHIVA